MTELGELDPVRKALEDRGGRLLALSVDPPPQNRKVRDQLGLKFSILSDPDAEAIKAYGLLHRGKGPDGTDIAIPAHVLIAPDGSILWRRLATRIQDRPAPAEVLAAIENMLKG